jgi:hypothetical protein
MKKIIYLTIAVFLIMQSFAQSPGDTIIVQTFDYSMTYNQAWGPPRDTIAHFPDDPNLTFEKIIMQYSMRCKNGQVNTSGGNNVACGEWDYSCHTYIHDSTRIDSIMHKTASHIISGFSGSTYTYSSNAVYNYFYTLSPSGVVLMDSIIAPSDTIIEFGISSFFGTLNHDIIDTISTSIYWQPYSHTYDTSGIIINTDTVSISGVININELIYYKRYPMAFQIMSFVTPYGIGLDLGPDGKTWHFDLTDYAPIFKGPKRITVSGGGEWQEDMDIKFLFIVGTPARDVLDMQQIWRPQSKDYGSIMSDNAFEPRDVLLHPDATEYKVKTVITGHGQQGEFISQNHYLNIDGGAQEYIWPVWTECSENPIFPQGGTWIYDRAGWCPGQASDLREDDITSLVTPGQIHNIDYGIVSATGTSNYWVSSQLVSYDETNFTLDASIVDILSPTNKVNYQKANPICSKPEITIQNTGSTPITSLTIEYWINNAPSKESYTWTGILSFLQKETIKLPDPSSLWDNMAINNNSFNVEIINSNGGADQYIHNNKMSSTFDPTPIYPNTFALWFQTNSGVINTFTQISESSWEFFDNDGSSIYASGDLISNTQFRDTLTFPEGCYTFKVTDTDDDGLDFWANNDGGGMVRFRELGAGWLKVFEGDFGRFIHHEFRTEGVLSSSDLDDINISIFPNPASDKILVSGDLANSSEIILTDNIGRIISITNIDKNNTAHKIDISRLSKGIYFISIDDNKTIKKIVKQ